MRKIVLGIIAWSISLNLVAQNIMQTEVFEGIVELKTGEIKKGYIQLKQSLLSIMGNSNPKWEVYYKENKEDVKHTRYKIKEVSLVQYGDRVYETIPLKKGKMHLIERVQSGKIKLYNQNVITLTGNLNNNMISGGISKYYYLFRKGDEKAERFIVNDEVIRFESFKNKAKKYFGDCLMLIDRLKEGVYKKRDIEDIVQFYNQNCSK